MRNDYFILNEKNKMKFSKYFNYSYAKYASEILQSNISTF